MHCSAETLPFCPIPLITLHRLTFLQMTACAAKKGGDAHGYKQRGHRLEQITDPGETYELARKAFETD